MSMLLIFSITVGQAGEVSISSTQKNIDAEEASLSNFWSGNYLKKSELCTSPGDGSDCSDQFYDCLKIESGHLGYLVELYSTQADQNVCSFTFQMDAVNGELVYKTQFGRVLLRRNGEALEISSQGVDPTALGLGVCGVHADIDGLKFPLASKSNIISACRAGN